MTRRWMIIGLVLAAALQTGLLAKLILDRARLLQTGTEVILETGMVDPRDLFRGHYVRLNLAISRIDRTTVPPLELASVRAPVWVSLAEGPDGFWIARSVSDTRPDGPSLKGDLQYSNADTINISYPFDRYFAPQDRALELEGLQAEGKLGLILALAPDGTGAVKGITVDGERIYIEPLY